VVPLAFAPHVSSNESRSRPVGVITDRNGFALSGTGTTGSRVIVSFGGRTTAAHHPLDSDGPAPRTSPRLICDPGSNRLLSRSPPPVSLGI